MGLPNTGKHGQDRRTLRDSPMSIRREFAPDTRSVKVHLFRTFKNLMHRSGAPKPLNSRGRRRFDG